MVDPGEHLIRRALRRTPPPEVRATLADDVLRRVASCRPGRASGGRPARWRLAVPWLAVAGASVAVLVHLELSSGARAVAWGLALAMVPLAYSATLWPGGAARLLALWGRSLLGEPTGSPAPGSLRRE
ncbi:MAG TPA: hypothetical protein VLF95_06950 [Vicinamibacteria bacterium]|nr:hypothetical protein [Vicinamibacteria bacterium]